MGLITSLLGLSSTKNIYFYNDIIAFSVTASDWEQPTYWLEIVN